MDQVIFWNFILATALGALIGIEREMPRSQTQVGWAHGFGGIRSYALLALLGAIMSWMDTMAHTQFWTIIGILISAIFVVAAYVYSSFRRDLMGVTSEYAALLTYMLGVMVMSGYRTIAVIIAILILIILSSKEYLSSLRNRFDRVDLGNALKFSVVALVVLPLLPDQKFSLLEMANWFAGWSLSWSHAIFSMRFFNPHSIWFFVVIMAGVEYIGYILSKVMGDRGGIVASGAVGGLISSTATTAAMTSKSRLHPNNRHAYAAATLIASCIMFIRVVLISGFYSPEILSTILIPAGVMWITLVAAAYWLYKKSKHEQVQSGPKDIKKDEYKSPFDLISALEFASIVVVIKFIAGVGLIYKTDMQSWLGESADKIFYYILGALSGLADVDAITQDMASKASEHALPFIIASTTILIAVISNNIVKSSIAYRFGEREFGKAVLTGFGISIGSGLTTLLLMNIFM
jgi:uncharacterized membrane protein (DUF4010 family)